MRSEDVRALFDFSYWANRRLLSSLANVTDEQWTAQPTFTYRSLRQTLIHILDVEWSWRILLQDTHRELRDVSLTEQELPTLDALAERWSSDEAEMRAWLESLGDDDLVRPTDLDDGRFPLWYYLVHIVTHSEQQRRDVQLLLRSFGIEPPDLEFLWYTDSTDDVSVLK